MVCSDEVSENNIKLLWDEEVVVVQPEWPQVPSHSLLSFDSWSLLQHAFFDDLAVTSLEQQDFSDFDPHA